MKAKEFNRKYKPGTAFWHQRPEETDRRAVRTVAAAIDLESSTIVEINVEPWLANVNSLTRQD
ncbi:hypothetical protein AM504_06770 [Klebsiella michiganensis]|nr:hypothetical protein C2U44_21245 [Klebsiella oxytoca]KLU44793.1 hypothetical protein ABE84_21080 [Klebsiella michiganensis]KLU52445.1 hypothetical protein ABE97_00640 [Klebsiella michiganensis]POT87705.1 hypothetical protein C3417_18615 [Klebsiella oxytoca]POV49830.1 hypothetical protein C3409_17615 [Klebsiella oxytoca]